MEGHVLLPRLGKNGNVSFIFDTGADTSLLMPLDGQRMGIDYGRFQKEETSLGIGGTSDNYIESAYLAFVGDEALFGYEIELRVCKPSKDLMTIPSLLGRDIIDQWRVTYDKSALELLAEVISSDAQQVLED
ncbi:MAG: hypothetical protein OXK79_03475 [Chloroflexota bacterium]|nr:hypothetical protein [Chloroflexota bacterium]